MARRRRGLLEEEGQALLELALVLPIFLLILVGAAEFARLEYWQIELSTAARSGAEYCAQNSCSTANLSTIAKADAPDVPNDNLIVSGPTYYYTCSTAPTVRVSAVTSCVSPSRALQHVEVYIYDNSVNPFFHLPGFPSTYTMQGHATMRVEQ